MNSVYRLLDRVRDAIRALMRRVALSLNHLSGGKISPNAITIIGLLAHIPVAYLITVNHLHWAAAVLLVVFGLFDTLDGELARLQQQTSAIGMFLDSTTDRMKEIIIYVGITALLIRTDRDWVILAVVGALGVSLLTSYINAWGEVVLTTVAKAEHKVNKTLRTGLLGFEVRMFLIVIGLAVNQLRTVVYIILILATITVGQRIMATITRLKHVQG